MKTKTYIDYLEHVVLSLLEERDDKETPVKCIESNHHLYNGLYNDSPSFSPFCIKQAIAVNSTFFEDIEIT